MQDIYLKIWRFHVPFFLSGTLKWLICIHSILQFEFKFLQNWTVRKFSAVDMLFRTSPCMIYIHDLKNYIAVFSALDFKVVYLYLLNISIEIQFFYIILQFKISGLLICYFGQVRAWYVFNNFKDYIFRFFSVGL